MRVGKKKQPTYRIVAADSRSPRDGRFIEIVGTYQPRSDPSEITVKNEKIIDWLSKGAQPTERVRKLLVDSGVWAEFESSRPAKKADKTRPPRTRKAERKAAAPKKPVRVRTAPASDSESSDEGA